MTDIKFDILSGNTTFLTQSELKRNKNQKLKNLRKKNQLRYIFQKK